jgi:hypothetical protein
LTRKLRVALLATLPDPAKIPAKDWRARLRASALRSFVASQKQTPATTAEARAQAWRNRLKLTDYEDSAEAREEQALADIYDGIFEHNRRLLAAEEEGKNWEEDRPHRTS